jgi:hypothetical protein
MSDLGAQLNQLTPEQRQAVMMQAQQEANQSILQELMKEMVTTCFEKCSGTSVCCTLRVVLMIENVFWWKKKVSLLV